MVQFTVHNLGIVKVKRQIHLYLKPGFSSLGDSYVNNHGYMARTIFVVMVTMVTIQLRHIR